MSVYCDDRNRTIAILRVLMSRERRWLHEDRSNEDRRDALIALEWAVRHLEGLPEHWVATVDGDEKP
jgi:hypothetical protein